MSFWDAPLRFAQSAPLKQDEMEAIEVLCFSQQLNIKTDSRAQSGGASLHT